MANPSPPQFRLAEAGERYSTQSARQERRGQRWRALGAAAIWYCVIVLLFAPFLYYHPYRAEVGVPSRTTVQAPVAFSVVDTEATAARRAQFTRNRPQVWVRNGTVDSAALQRLKQFLDLANRIDPSTPEDLRTLTEQARDQLDIGIDMNTAGQFMDSRLASLRPPMTRRELARDLELVINELFQERQIVDNKVSFQAHAGQGVLVVENERRSPTTRPPDPKLVLWWPQEVRQYLLGTALPRYFAGDAPETVALRQAIADLLMSICGPNVVHDVARTEAIHEDNMARLSSQPIEKQYVAGEIIAKEGEPLTQLQVDALNQLDAERHKNMFYKMVGIILFVAIIFAAVGIYLRRFRGDVPLNASLITLHVLPPFFALAIGWALSIFGVENVTIMLWYPSVMIGILSSLLISPQVAFILVLVSALTFGIIVGCDLMFLVYTLFGGFAAVLASRQVRARREILSVGLKVGLINMLTLMILGLLVDQSLPRAMWLLVGFASSVLLYAPGTLLLLLLFEHAFNVVTDLRLLELTGLENDVMRQLEEKAPGSFQHVLNVTKLAEAAANAIGANYLLVRAGAYYHDIGKMVKPKYFSENQTSLEDKKAHGRLSPYMSVLIIKNHVKEGIELARKFGLPQRIIDFIPEHHGTSLIRYFYNEALKRYEESEAVDPVREEDFRYPGPKPRSIETAIVMLADSVEAIAASKFTGGQVNESELRRTTQTAISEKFNDGQFDECSLTLSHLHLIREAFVKTLAARYHFRVQYPTLPGRKDAPASRADVRDARETTQASISVAGPAA